MVTPGSRDQGQLHPDPKERPRRGSEIWFQGIPESALLPRVLDTTAARTEGNCPVSTDVSAFIFCLFIFQAGDMPGQGVTWEGPGQWHLLVRVFVLGSMGTGKGACLSAGAFVLGNLVQRAGDTAHTGSPKGGFATL